MRTSAASTKAAVQRLRVSLHHYVTLLAAELLFILAYPFLNRHGSHDGLFRLLAVIVFMSAIYAMLGRGRLTVVAIGMGVPAITIHVLNLFGHLEVLHTAVIVMGILFLGFITTVFVWTIVSNPSVTTDTLAGAVATYLLIGITFGMLYALIDRLVPGAFRDTIEPGKHLTQSEFTFFSFVTLTTVGYGDIVPWDAHARAFAIIESVIGIMYPALLVSRLVGLHGLRRTDT